MSAEAKLEVDEELYLDSFRPHLMDVVFTWANGSTFAQICKMTEVFEGNITIIHILLNSIINLYLTLHYFPAAFWI